MTCSLLLLCVSRGTILLSLSQIFPTLLSNHNGFHLFVETSPDFTVPLKDVSAVAGETVTLTCEASKPNAKANWLKDGKPFSFKDKNKYNVSVDGTTHTLTIPKSEVDDSAEFTCSINGSKTQSKVTVQEGIACRLCCVGQLSFSRHTNIPNQLTVSIS